MPSNSLTDLLRLAAGSWKERSGIAVHPATSSGVIPKVVRLVIAWQQLQNSPPRFGSSSEALGAGGLSSLECPWLVIFLRPEIPKAQEEKSPQQHWALGSGLHGLLIHLKQALAPFSLDFAQTLLCFSSKVEVFRSGICASVRSSSSGGKGFLGFPPIRRIVSTWSFQSRASCSGPD